MGKKKVKIKKKCCGKYLKSGRHCKNCPLVNREGAQTKEKKTTKNKKGGKKK